MRVRRQRIVSVQIEKPETCFYCQHEKVNPQADPSLRVFHFWIYNNLMKKTTPDKPKKKMGPPAGNKNAEKFATAAERQEAFTLYCLHIAAGYSGSSFYEPCVEETIENLMKRYPAEFDPDKLRRARAKGRMFWEDVGNKGTTGRIKGFNAHSWKFNMQNRLGWKDRSEVGMDEPTRAVFKLKMGKPLGDEKA